MNKVFELISKYLLIPLIMKGVKAVIDWWNTKKEHKEIDESHKKKYDDFKSDPNPDDFSKLP